MWRGMTYARSINQMHEEIVRLRMSVALLGESDTAPWWSSSFASSASEAFMLPIFGLRTPHARYQGLVEAARLVHDDRIGVGRVYHLFRLPDHEERRAFEIAQTNMAVLGAVDSPSAALALLADLASGKVQSKEGPTLITSKAAIGSQDWIGEVASLYRLAFAKSVQCFPYFRLS